MIRLSTPDLHCGQSQCELWTHPFSPCGIRSYSSHSYFRSTDPSAPRFHSTGVLNMRATITSGQPPSFRSFSGVSCTQVSHQTCIHASLSLPFEKGVLGGAASIASVNVRITLFPPVVRRR